jgi:pyruvate dehydrogenase E2 component (dihydrolipoamide acetyltransferase)
MERNIHTVNLPDIGEGVVEGEIIEWLKQVGDPVKRDEPVVVVMTDKATVELSAPYPGTIAKHYFQVGEISLRDRPLYDIELTVGEVTTTSKTTQLKESVYTPPPKIDSPVKTSQARCSDQVQATPKVRHLAYELGIDIEKVNGTGSHGRVLLQDLTRETPSSNHPSTPLVKHLEDDEVVHLHGIRAVMARRMGQTYIPQFSYCEMAEASHLVKQRQHLKEQIAAKGIVLSYMPFLIYTLSRVAKIHPEINSSIDAHSCTWIKHRQHNIGIATAGPDGLIVPVLKGVQAMNLQEIIDAFETLKMKTLAGKLAASDMKEATITISNFGTLGDGLWATPMISEGEVTILATARIRKNPIVKDGEIVIADQLPLSWSFDHRLVDGELAAKISTNYCNLLQDLI